MAVTSDQVAAALLAFDHALIDADPAKAPAILRPIPEQLAAMRAALEAYEFAAHGPGGGGYPAGAVVRLMDVEGKTSAQVARILAIDERQVEQIYARQKGRKP